MAIFQNNLPQEFSVDEHFIRNKRDFRMVHRPRDCAIYGCFIISMLLHIGMFLLIIVRIGQLASLHAKSGDWLDKQKDIYIAQVNEIHRLCSEGPFGDQNKPPSAGSPSPNDPVSANFLSSPDTSSTAHTDTHTSSISVSSTMETNIRMLVGAKGADGASHHDDKADGASPRRTAVASDPGQPSTPDPGHIPVAETALGKITCGTDPAKLPGVILHPDSSRSTDDSTPTLNGQPLVRNPSFYVTDIISQTELLVIVNLVLILFILIVLIYWYYHNSRVASQSGGRAKVRRCSVLSVLALLFLIGALVGTICFIQSHNVNSIWKTKYNPLVLLALFESILSFSLILVGGLIIAGFFYLHWSQPKSRFDSRLGHVFEDGIDHPNAVILPSSGKAVAMMQKYLGQLVVIKKRPASNIKMGGANTPEEGFNNAGGVRRSAAQSNPIVESSPLSSIAEVYTPPVSTLAGIPSVSRLTEMTNSGIPAAEMNELFDHILQESKMMTTSSQKLPESDVISHFLAPTDCHHITPDSRKIAMFHAILGTRGEDQPYCILAFEYAIKFPDHDVLLLIKEEYKNWVKRFGQTYRKMVLDSLLQSDEVEVSFIIGREHVDRECALQIYPEELPKAKNDGNGVPNASDSSTSTGGGNQDDLVTTNNDIADQYQLWFPDRRYDYHFLPVNAIEACTLYGKMLGRDSRAAAIEGEEGFDRLGSERSQATDFGDTSEKLPLLIGDNGKGKLPPLQKSGQGRASISSQDSPSTAPGNATSRAKDRPCNLIDDPDLIEQPYFRKYRERSTPLNVRTTFRGSNGGRGICNSGPPQNAGFLAKAVDRMSATSNARVSTNPHGPAKSTMKKVYSDLDNVRSNENYLPMWTVRTKLTLRKDLNPKTWTTQAGVLGTLNFFQIRNLVERDLVNLRVLKSRVHTWGNMTNLALEAEVKRMLGLRSTSVWPIIEINPVPFLVLVGETMSYLQRYILPVYQDNSRFMGFAFMYFGMFFARLFPWFQHYRSSIRMFYFAVLDECQMDTYWPRVRQQLSFVEHPLAELIAQYDSLTPILAKSIRRAAEQVLAGRRSNVSINEANIFLGQANDYTNISNPQAALHSSQHMLALEDDPYDIEIRKLLNDAVADDHTTELENLDIDILKDFQDNLEPESIENNMLDNMLVQGEENSSANNIISPVTVTPKNTSSLDSLPLLPRYCHMPRVVKIKRLRQLLKYDGISPKYISETTFRNYPRIMFSVSRVLTPLCETPEGMLHSEYVDMTKDQKDIFLEYVVKPNIFGQILSPERNRIPLPTEDIPNKTIKDLIFFNPGSDFGKRAPDLISMRNSVRESFLLPTNFLMRVSSHAGILGRSGPTHPGDPPDGASIPTRPGDGPLSRMINDISLSHGHGGNRQHLMHSASAGTNLFARVSNNLDGLFASPKKKLIQGPKLDGLGAINLKDSSLPRSGRSGTSYNTQSQSADSLATGTTPFKTDSGGHKTDISNYRYTQNSIPPMVVPLSTSNAGVNAFPYSSNHVYDTGSVTPGPVATLGRRSGSVQQSVEGPPLTPRQKLEKLKHQVQLDAHVLSLGPEEMVHLMKSLTGEQLAQDVIESGDYDVVLGKNDSSNKTSNTSSLPTFNNSNTGSKSSRGSNSNFTMMGSSLNARNTNTVANTVASARNNTGNPGSTARSSVAGDFSPRSTIGQTGPSSGLTSGGLLSDLVVAGSQNTTRNSLSGGGTPSAAGTVKGAQTGQKSGLKKWNRKDHLKHERDLFNLEDSYLNIVQKQGMACLLHEEGIIEGGPKNEESGLGDEDGLVESGLVTFQSHESVEQYQVVSPIGSPFPSPGSPKSVASSSNFHSNVVPSTPGSNIGVPNAGPTTFNISPVEKVEERAPRPETTAASMCMALPELSDDMFTITDRSDFDNLSAGTRNFLRHKARTDAILGQESKLVLFTLSSWPITVGLSKKLRQEFNYYAAKSSAVVLHLLQELEKNETTEGDNGRSTGIGTSTGKPPLGSVAEDMVQDLDLHGGNSVEDDKVNREISQELHKQKRAIDQGWEKQYVNPLFDRMQQQKMHQQQMYKKTTTNRGGAAEGDVVVSEDNVVYYFLAVMPDWNPIIFPKASLCGHLFHYSKEEPFAVLFKYCDLIIHHGGNGVRAEVAEAAKPSVIVSFNYDQPFNGYNTEVLGVGRHIPIDVFVRYPQLFFADALPELLVGESGEKTRKNLKELQKKYLAEVHECDAKNRALEFIRGDVRTKDKRSEEGCCVP